MIIKGEDGFLRKSAARKFFWLVALLCAAVILATGSEEGLRRAIGWAILTLIMILFAGYVSLYLFWRDEDDD